MKIPNLLASIAITLRVAAISSAHDIGKNDDTPPRYDFSVKPPGILLAQANVPQARAQIGGRSVRTNRPVQAAVFEAFAPKVSVRWDERFLFVESNGLPAHNMMVGITAWQQQVPLPQNYTGTNAWQIPLAPVPAKSPRSIKGQFLRGAIALAANGIPIFNPQNNRGEVSQEIGELDQWGGHCGRADDYHYHAAPLHLQSVVGKGQPIAFALDGYAIYGLTEPDGSQPAGLDAFNGHTTALGYHYHASVKYPYVNGGFHGEVAEAGGQVDPQPRAQPVREAGAPLRGAKITAFGMNGNSSKLSYEVGGEKHAILYTVNADGSVPFEFQNGSAGTTKQTYTRREGGSGGAGPRGPGGPRPDGERPPRGGGVQGPQGEVGSTDRPPRPEGGSGGQRPGEQETASQFGPDAMKKPNATFVLTSIEVKDGGALPVDYTGDGSGATLPLAWRGTPAGTKGYALIMDHLAPGNVMKHCWTMWDIPATVTSLPKNARGVGKIGTSFKGQIGYEPPHSQGPGAKTYVLTVYALSAPLQITQQPREVNRDVLLAAMKDKVLASSSLSVVYTRTGTGSNDTPPPRREDASGAGGRPRPPQQGAAGDPGGAPGGPRKPWMQVHGAELDANKDGVITTAELMDDMDRAFAIYDHNKDGTITAAELEAAGDVREGAAFAGFIHRHFAELDTNGDGSVSREEFATAAKKIFDAADADHDGKVTKAEWESAAQAPLRKGPPAGPPATNALTPPPRPAGN